MSAIIDQEILALTPTSVAVPTRSRQLRAQIAPVAELDEATRQAMWALFAAHYAEVSRDAFLSDLQRKQAVILLLAADGGSLCGFSTLEHYERIIEGRRVGVIFSGDTVVAREYWGQTALQRAFYGYIARCKLARPWRPLYWFLISKGYKTYLLLSRNFVSYWPRCDQPTPPRVRQLTDRLARERFGAAYRPSAGILHFERCLGRLRPEIARVDQELANREEDVRFFVERNPGYVDGDELCCLGLVSTRQLLYFPLRLLGKQLRRIRRNSCP